MSLSTRGLIDTIQGGLPRTPLILRVLPEVLRIRRQGIFFALAWVIASIGSLARRALHFLAP